MSVVPCATYRLQFHRGFTFEDARKLVPYLAWLGISHVYASPFFRASPGSTHGYDVCDHNVLNPEIGDRESFEALTQELETHGLGLIADFVPNHMGVEGALNPWWRDVLESGPSSPYAKFFDIEWRPLKREIENKVLLPVLGDHYGRTLEDGGLRLALADGGFVLCHGDLTLPLAPGTTLSLLRSAIDRLSTAPPEELGNIITSIENLSPRNETTSNGFAERAKKRRLIRKRLARVCMENTAVEAAIQDELRDWNDTTAAGYLDRMDNLISAQAYRLSSWRVAGEEINYRRFFDVNTLAAIRMELPEVFDATHQLLLELIASDQISGVRIDHIDGLAYPKDYLERLRDHAGKPIYLLVEKILGPEEKMPEDWPVDGTTGYEFGALVTQLQVRPPDGLTLAAVYDKFTGSQVSYSDVAYRSKKLVMETTMSSELSVLGDLLHRLAQSHWWYRDFTVRSLQATVREVIACFPVYRTYIDPAQAAPETDRRVINRAIALARQRNKAMEGILFEFLHDALLPVEEHPHPMDEALRRAFVLKFQQCTGPVTAKGVEDTSFYVYNRLVALNEVGSDPASPGATLEMFHAQNVARLTDLPRCMLATSTHDTKRSEDVRARQAVLSELVDEWERQVQRWHAANQRHRREIDGELAPDLNEEYLLYQTLVGAWPLEGLKGGNRAEFMRRIQEYMVKALREAKVNTSWLEPNPMWDEAVREFVNAILDGSDDNRFASSLAPFASQIARFGAVNSLTQTILKLTCPGVPDLYQGTELWDFSLVDPDNRRQVDFELRQQQLESIVHVHPAELIENWRDGRIKMFVIHRLLAFRRLNPLLFAHGTYAGVLARGAFADKIVAFERQNNKQSLLVIVPRHVASLGFPPVGSVWGDTVLPKLAKVTRWRDLFTGHEFDGENISIADVFSALPFAVLEAV